MYFPLNSRAENRRDRQTVGFSRPVTHDGYIRAIRENDLETTQHCNVRGEIVNRLTERQADTKRRKKTVKKEHKQWQEKERKKNNKVT